MKILIDVDNIIGSLCDAVLSVYNEDNFLYENGKNMLTNMLDDINKHKGDYSYSKPYTLEDFYGLAIK